MLVLARELHQLPETIEAMDEYWFERMVLFMEAEAIDANRRDRERQKRTR